MNLKTNLTTVNFSSGRSGSSIKYLVFHYTANDGDTDEGNANYFKSVNRNASAHYFVDEDSITQVVLDQNTAWHCGDTQKYTNGGASMKGIVKNVNSIGIEMCSDKVNGQYVITEATQENAIELGRILMKKYNIPITNVFRHYDVTGKICPEPFVKNINQWNEFKERLVEEVKTEKITVSFNGKDTEIETILYNGNNFMKIRDLADADKTDKLEVSYDVANKKVSINTK